MGGAPYVNDKVSGQCRQGATPMICRVKMSPKTWNSDDGVITKTAMGNWERGRHAYNTVRA